jgi:hypothetical protein
MNYTFKEYIRAGLTFLGIMTFLAGFLTLNGLHYAGVI